MSQSFLVLGSAAIFSTLLIFSLLCAQAVDGRDYDIHATKKTVAVYNYIHPDIALTIHCWSSEDDLGEHTLYYRQNFRWRFRVNFWESTKFVCDSNWYDPARKGNHTVKFTAYKARRDWMKHCVNNCDWSIQLDGGYYGDGLYVGRFPLEKMFSYN
ncbi:hypothetical protein MKW94_002833 [Papaver nudicaule]|uniref:S-protein homolog n=1 Tax=Papaver nudicaule TaxID=74823 RepID=A0AA41VLH2_PAPNU|nr:hypothetical protein [Papaver nudicaule]